MASARFDFLACLASCHWQPRPILIATAVVEDQEASALSVSLLVFPHALTAARWVEGVGFVSGVGWIVMFSMHDTQDKGDRRHCILLFAFLII